MADTGRLVGTGCFGPFSARLAIMRAQRQLAEDAGVHVHVRNFAVRRPRRQARPLPPPSHRRLPASQVINQARRRPRLSSRRPRRPRRQRRAARRWAPSPSTRSWTATPSRPRTPPPRTSTATPSSVWPGGLPERRSAAVRPAPARARREPTRRRAPRAPAFRRDLLDRQGQVRPRASNECMNAEAATRPTRPTRFPRAACPARPASGSCSPPSRECFPSCCATRTARTCSSAFRSPSATCTAPPCAPPLAHLLPAQPLPPPERSRRAGSGRSTRGRSATTPPSTPPPSTSRASTPRGSSPAEAGDRALLYFVPVVVAGHVTQVLPATDPLGAPVKPTKMAGNGGKRLTFVTRVRARA